MAPMQIPKANKVTTGKKLPVHPSYAQMIKEAIVSLKERSGSSQMAIAKFVEDKHKARNLSPNFKKLLLSQLKKLVALGNLVKVKNSFKLTAKPKKVPSKTTAKPKKVPSKTAHKPKKVPSKTAHKPKKVLSKTAVEPKKAKKTKLGPAKAKAMKAKKPKSIKSPAKKKVVGAKKAKK